MGPNKPKRPSDPSPSPPPPGETARAAGRTLSSCRIAALPLLDGFLRRLRLEEFLRDHLPHEDRYLRTRDERLDWLKVILAGRAAEQAVFGRVTTGAANDLEQAASIARSMVFEWGMGESSQAQTVRADNYALSEETKRLRDLEQRTITDGAYADAVALVVRHGAALDALAAALLEHETLDRAGIAALLAGVPRESHAALDIGVELPRDVRELFQPEPVLGAAEPARPAARPAREPNQPR